jgi:phospholipid/cholesterol/gamma-HCH transport system ATP-binding protein
VNPLALIGRVFLAFVATTERNPIRADVIDALIAKYMRDLGATALSITPGMISAYRIADRVAMLHKGEIIWTGPIADIDDSGNLLVDQFVHGSADRPIQMEVWAL